MPQVTPQMAESLAIYHAGSIDLAIEAIDHAIANYADDPGTLAPVLDLRARLAARRYSTPF